MNHQDDKAHAIMQARDWITNNVLILDTETTGLGSDAEICEISMIDCAGNTVMDTLVKPVGLIPLDATNIHGISNKMVVDAPPWKAVQPQFLDLIAGRRVVIYNSQYDSKIIIQTAKANGCFTNGVLDRMASSMAMTDCAMKAYAAFYGQANERDGRYKWQKLTKAADRCRVAVDGQAHRALADCKMTLGVIRAMADTPTSDQVPVEKLYLTAFPGGELKRVTVLGENHNINDGWYIRFHQGNTDTTTSDFLFDIPDGMET